MHKTPSIDHAEMEFGKRVPAECVPECHLLNFCDGFWMQRNY